MSRISGFTFAVPPIIGVGFLHKFYGLEKVLEVASNSLPSPSFMCTNFVKSTILCLSLVGLLSRRRKTKLVSLVSLGSFAWYEGLIDKVSNAFQGFKGNTTKLPVAQPAGTISAVPMPSDTMTSIFTRIPLVLGLAGLAGAVSVAAYALYNRSAEAKEQVKDVRTSPSFFPLHDQKDPL